MTIRQTLLRWTGDALWLAMLCGFPVVFVVVFAVALFSPQGQDLLRTLQEGRMALDTRGLAAAYLATPLFAFSVWYSLRWLLTGHFLTVRLSLHPTHCVRIWTPRIAGTVVLVVASWSLQVSFPNEGLSAHALGFAGLALAFLHFTWRRGRILAEISRRAPRLAFAPEGRDPVTFQPSAFTSGKKLPAAPLRVMKGAAVTGLVVAIVFVISPISAPRFVGSAALLPLALTFMTFFAAMYLTWVPLSHGLPGLAPAVIGAVAVFGLVNDNHSTRVVAPLGGPDARETLEQRWSNWRAANGNPEQYVVVAAEGGGIRAAYWTVSVLGALEERAPEIVNSIFALSGVSGGALGSAAWLVEQAADDRVNCDASAALSEDFLSPALAATLFGDLIQRFLPYVPYLSPYLDRSRAIETSWQRAFAGCGARMAEPLTALVARNPSMPSLLLNTTIVESGGRAVQANVTSESLFIDAVELMAPRYSVAAQPLSGQIHNSARFPVVSPAGTVSILDGEEWKKAFRIVDGGYFDNSGATTAFDVIRGVANLEGRKREPFIGTKPVLLILQNDVEAPQLPRGDLCSEPPKWPPRRLNPLSVFLPEMSSIIKGLYNARSAHAGLAVYAAALGVCELGGSVFVAALTPGKVSPPLGWALSQASRDAMEEAAVRVSRRIAAEIHRPKPPTPNAFLLGPS